MTYKVHLLEVGYDMVSVVSESKFADVKHALIYANDMLIKGRDVQIVGKKGNTVRIYALEYQYLGYIFGYDNEKHKLVVEGWDNG